MQASRESTSAFCEHCQQVVRTKVELHTVQLSRTRIRVPHVLVRACSECGEVLEVPRESFPQLRVFGAA
ncbi:MAG: hypothetical protein ACJ8AO_05405 [Gemmatimonadaceae bacterium]|jgi:hypothetical protein